VSEGEAAHLGWVMAHPARARRRVRAARVFISPEVAGAPITSKFGGESLKVSESFRKGTLGSSRTRSLLGAVGDLAETNVLCMYLRSKMNPQFLAFGVMKCMTLVAPPGESK
jgi:hypothetical protein